MKKSKMIAILAFLCFMETGFILSFPRQDMANKVASVPLIGVFGFLIFNLIKNLYKKN